MITMKKQIRLLTIIIILFAANILGLCSAKHQPLLNKNEEVLISFKLANSNKVLTVATSKKEPGYIVYRFGQKNKIELEYPKDLSKSWERFTYSYYFRGGGPENEGLDLNYLRFTNGNYTYTIYEERQSEDGSEKVGVIVRNNITKKETDLKGDYSSIEGSLIMLRFEKRINNGDIEY
jgi:hypothetical protein